MTEEQRLEIYCQGGEYEDGREKGSLPAIITPDTVTSLFKDTPKDRRIIEWRGSMRSVFNGRWNSWSRVFGLHGLAMMCGLT